MANQATENLFNAVDEIINARLQKLNYDKTIKAVIVNADQASRGLYEVSEIGAEKTNVFTAQSDNTSYQYNDCVYVTIPRGDTASENKIIIGKYIEDGDAYYNYVNPMNGYLDISGNLIHSLDASQWGLTANYKDVSRIDLWSAYDLNLRGFDRLALKAQFKTWLQSLEITSGNYGLVLIIEDDKGTFTPFSLTTREMYGNPYYYETFYAQETLLDISQIDEIKSMTLTLFQANDFYTSEGEYAPSVQGEDNERIPSNIFMKAPYVSVGYDVSNFSGDDLRIYTQDEQEYNSNEPSVIKTIEAKWIHAGEGTSAIAVDHEDDIPRNPDYGTDDDSDFPQPLTKADLTWYQYDTTSSGTLITGKNWRQLDSALNQFAYSFETDSSETGSTISFVRFQAMIEVPSLRYVNAQFAVTDMYRTMVNLSDTTAYLECVAIFQDIMRGDKTQNDGRKEITEIYNANRDTIDENMYGDMIKALNEYVNRKSEINYVKSGELTFPNLGYAPDKYASDSIAELEIIVDPGGLQGQYLIYDDTGMITNPSEAEQVRYCEAVYRTLAGVVTENGEEVKYEIDNTERICWYIPLESTMIATPVEGIDYTTYDTYDPDFEVTDVNNEAGLPLGTYCKIERVPQIDETVTDPETRTMEHHMYARQNFRIKDYYTQMEANNVIYCTITKQGKLYAANGQMTFGIAGTNGTDATFVLKMYEVDEDGASISDVPAFALSVKTDRYSEDKDGNIITRFTPAVGAVFIVPELYDYNNKLMEGYFADHEVTYSIMNNDKLSQPFKLEIYGEGKRKLTWDGTPAKGLDDENNDFYLIIEAEVPYQIIYEFDTYTQEDLDADPTLVELGKKVGDYKLDADGNKVPTLDANGNQVSREDKLKTYLPVSIVRDKLLSRTKKVEEADTLADDQTKYEPANYQRQIIGANKVIYDRNGSNAKYYKDPYQLLNGLLDEVSGVEWYARIRAGDGKSEAERASIESFYPTVSPSWKLVPLEMYILGNQIAENFCVYGKKNGQVICVQPVLIMQNKYGSAMLNKWDGSLTIDEKNGTILASMVGAGIKDENNTFSGVLMGNVDQAFNDNHNGLGLYGFHQNDQSFGFNIDGTAFIGKAGHGRICFDGNSGTIRSGAYSDGSDTYKYPGTNAPRPQQGMEIDLDGSDGINASLKMFGPYGGFVVDTKSVKLDPYWDVVQKKIVQPKPEELGIVFKLFTGDYNKNSERGMIYFDNDGQYIQSTNYNGKYGVAGHADRLSDLKGDIKFDALPKGLNGQTIPPGWTEASEDSNGNPVYISYAGDEGASAGTFIDLRNGWIDTRSGIVGGWKIGQNSITSMQNEVILYAGDGNDVPYIRIGAVRNNVMEGKLWIADYRVIGQTVSGGVVDGQSFSWTETGEVSATDYSAFEGETEALQKLSYLTTTLKDSTFESKGLNSWTLLDDTEDNREFNLGVTLETAQELIGENESKDKALKLIVWKPTKIHTDTKTIATLGTTYNPWDTLYAKTGIFQYETFTGYDSSNNTGWHLVATQDWVSKVIVQVLNERIRKVNNLASSALKKAKSAISKIMSWCATWNGQKIMVGLEFGGAMSGKLKYDVATVTANTDNEGNLTGTIDITTEETETKADAGWLPAGSWCKGATYRDWRLGAGGANSVGWYLDALADAIGGHTHYIKAMTATAGSIKFDTVKSSETTAATELAIFAGGADGGVSCSGANGKITVSVTVAGATATGNFNIADWDYYQSKIQSAYKAGFKAGQDSVTMTQATHSMTQAKYNTGSGDTSISSTKTLTNVASIKLIPASRRCTNATLNKPSMTDPSWSTLY